MTTKEIVDAVTNYVRDENAKYAILIDGAWGSGKTYLYENYLVDAIDSVENGKNERKYNVYISLYGISSIDALSKQLVTSYLIYVKGRGNNVVKKGLKPVAGIIGVVSSAFSFSIGPVSADLTKVYKKISDSINAQNMVICFDDLERCTIPINEFLGFVNNLVEHCSCKVLILADEKNIGKIYANTNIEQKYLTVLSGNRKVVESLGADKKIGTQAQSSAGDSKEEITVEEVKKLNEILYSENYLYKDIKEKVIGKTMFYYPKLEAIVRELIGGNEKKNGIIENGQYKDYLLNHLNGIVNAFKETENQNLRIVKYWVFSFRKIYDATTRFFSNDKYYKDILDDFLHYSIWKVGAVKKNKKISLTNTHRNQDMVYFEGHEYTHIFRYSFIDVWIEFDVLDDEDLCKACRAIIERRKQEDVDNPPKIHSSGTALGKLRNWKFMEDFQVTELLNDVEKEIEENKYAYYDYSNIIATFLVFQDNGLYEGNLEHVKDIMIRLIESDTNIQEENKFPKDFSSEKMRSKYDELYTPISEARQKRNHTLRKEEQEDEKIYSNADAFYEHCCRMENYYISHRSFLEYIDFEKLYELINESNNNGVYAICRAFEKIYFMSNLKDFYIADVEKLKKIWDDLWDESVIKSNGITRQIALDSLRNLVKHNLIHLGVEEEVLREGKPEQSDHRKP